jgi:hypothetical protein
MYAPVVNSARTKKRYMCGPYEAAFLDLIVAEGPIGYEFIIVVFEQQATAPFLFVTSEKNDHGAEADIFQELGLEPDMLSLKTGKSHFLCLFDKTGHHNLGDSDEWGDAGKFELAALKILAEQLGETPVVVDR